ncbi:MAG: hypothetical protein ABIA47_04990 [bacterium]
MDNFQLQRLIKLAQRTGDTLIVAGEGEPVVVMPVDQYEELVGFGGDLDWVGDDFDEIDGIEDLPFDDIPVPAMEWHDEDDDDIDSDGDQPITVEEINAITEAAMLELEAEKAAEKDLETGEKPEITDSESGEERFYLEPIE